MQARNELNYSTYSFKVPTKLSIETVFRRFVKEIVDHEVCNSHNCEKKTLN